MQPWPEIAAQISTTTRTTFVTKEITPIGGGCINETVCISDDNQRFFVKLNTTDNLAMFEAEAAGLMEIHNSQTLRVPLPVCWGNNEDNAWLILEYLDINNTSKANATALGSGLAAMHRTSLQKFGWIRNNTIGNTPQINTPSTNWLQFWRSQRLGYQLNLAKTNGYLGKLQTLGEQLLANLDTFFVDKHLNPSLLHGDLWGGNYAFDNTGQPVIFDPAVYYGDRETDIAMTELFGGFPNSFYSAYQHDYPLDSGYNNRKTLYNLYHILNHLNLFGGGYCNQAEHMINKLLAEIR
tara:strand:- start:2520 stop:3404 length:885 start_codon:yes stop_codon:yes gene_type:complete